MIQPALLPALAYLRKSTDDQAQSIGLQQASIERGAREQGYEIAAWFKDEGVSGTIPMDERPGGRKLFEYLRAHPLIIKAVFFDDITRMERSNDLHCYSYRIYEFHQKYRVIAFFVSDGQRSDSPQMCDFLICVIKGMESSEYSKKLAYKTARGQIAVVEKGFLSGRQAPYGMDRLLIDVDGKPHSRWVVHDDGSLQKFGIDGSRPLDKPIPPITRFRHEADGRGGIRQVEIRVTEPIPKTKNQRVTLIAGCNKAKLETVRFIFKTFAHTSTGLRGIAQALNLRGTYPPCTNGGAKRRHALPGQDAFWRMETIRYILLNPAYYGVIAFNRRSSSKFWRIEKDQQGWRQVPQGIVGQTGVRNNVTSDWVQEAIRPEAAIISKELFDKAQQKLRRRSESKTVLPRDRRHTYLLSGLVRCQCGSRMAGIFITRTKNYKNGSAQRFEWRKYACTTYHASGGTYCKHNSVDANALETFILQQTAQFLVTLINPESVLKKARSLLKDRAVTVNDQPELREKMQELEHNLASLPQMDSVSPTLRTAFAEQKRVWEEERTAIQHRLAQQSPTSMEPDTIELAALAREMLNGLQELDRNTHAQQLREIVNRCIADIRLRFHPVQEGKRTLHRLEQGELVFLAKPGRLSHKVNRGDWI